MIPPCFGVGAHADAEKRVFITELKVFGDPSYNATDVNTRGDIYSSSILSEVRFGGWGRLLSSVNASKSKTKDQKKLHTTPALYDH